MVSLYWPHPLKPIPALEQESGTLGPQSLKMREVRQAPTSQLSRQPKRVKTRPGVPCSRMWCPCRTRSRSSKPCSALDWVVSRPLTKQPAPM